MAKPIQKMGADEILTISKKLFFAGFCFLPFLWLYNVLYLWPVRNRSDLSPQVRRCNVPSCRLGEKSWILVDHHLLPPCEEEGRIPPNQASPPCSLDFTMSAVLSVLLFVIFSVWYGIFVDYRLNWGKTGDLLTVVLVKGV